MKAKVASLFLCIFMLLPMLVACGQASAPAPIDDGSASSEASTSSQATDIAPYSASCPGSSSSSSRSAGKDPYADESYFDYEIREILEGIKTGDYKTVADHMMATNPEAYRFLRDMTVDSYEIVESIAEASYDLRCKVKFTVSKSSNDYFPVGESYWDLWVHDGIEGVYRFTRSKDENAPNSTTDTELSKVDTGINLCYAFSQNFGVFETTTDFGAAVRKNYPNEDSLIHAIVHFCSATKFDSWDELTVDAVDAYMWDTLRITGINYRAYSVYLKDQDIISCEGHGGRWLYWRPVSRDYNQSANLYTVVINYYADTALLVVAKTMQYQYTIFGDGTYRLYSAELVYDSGYYMRGGVI